MKKPIIYLIPVLLFLAVGLLSCQHESKKSAERSQVTQAKSIQTPDPLKQVILMTPEGDEVKTSLAWKMEDQSKGLSGTRPEEFTHSEGKLFFYLMDETRYFWMPDTYFDLDIIFLDEGLKIVEILKKVPHHIGTAEPIPRAPGIYSRHVFEMKADSPIAAKLRVGDFLQWRSPLSLQQTESKIRQQQ
jgi:uncharacterized membrane protein (UPF0127 family)